ncbi:MULTISPECIES: uracil phosphoribosyltransferase [unclassified Campylobacter]|uniref:uracil phosphoribosyltransferase n=1 Tax=unclassified Campylobacter TaxID=2593542 RepID=UPI001237FA8C|nr:MULTISPECIES: uracil phosphoribosyltransferase [unclassified Campylobacter]KAA6225090.1 uracil phosphoribosyltransferase [Campylobacter sp. LR196d]KAA6226104.1 uracil phosphoribosyltransferase [Campylobacter sp. LR185c]KAA6228051.1 uracil phosphoribosyltransferase [Campylobacter sp. LR286c]KAA6231304.1 uracil phosphoribosyltransferase [Campylobacter sp. LR264d]KAA6231516.1 uracil phosphoribosyltransferase [Campylobacter sp. LR291e]
MKNVHLINHALVSHKLSILRSELTKPNEFRMLINELTCFLLMETTRNLTLKESVIQTPLCKTKVLVLNEKIMLCPILRAGLGMLDSALNLIPNASVGFLGFKRDEISLKPDFYFHNFPNDAKNRTCIVIDPMLATGGTAINACDFLKKEGIKKIIYLSIIAAPEGLEAFSSAHSDIEFFVASIDEKLNSQGYILPGLGDAGDRIFNTMS